MPADENTTDSLTAIDRAVERLVSALESIATKHGSEAVDLAMIAYQMDAIKYISLCLLGMLFFIPSIKLWRRGVTEFKKEHADSDDYMPYFFLGTMLGIPGIVGAVAAFSPVHWLAAFGNPEILVATNVLKSAGLL